MVPLLCLLPTHLLLENMLHCVDVVARNVVNLAEEVQSVETKLSPLELIDQVVKTVARVLGDVPPHRPDELGPQLEVHHSRVTAPLHAGPQKSGDDRPCPAVFASAPCDEAMDQALIKFR